MPKQMQTQTKHNRYPANIYFFKVNNRNTRKSCEICSKLTIKIPERRQMFDLVLNMPLVYSTSILSDYN